MNSNYSADIYLTPNDLNQVENKIEELTNKVQEKIYENQQSSLRNIEVGDDLSGKTLYLSFPRESYNYIPENSVDLITSDNNISITAQTQTNDAKLVYMYYEGYEFIMYGRRGETHPLYDNTDNPYLNFIRFKLPDDFGTVTFINSEYSLYQYIKIYDNENIIPEYIKKTWTINEIPYIQAIDNIEQGVKNLGDYFTKPLGWITTKEWIKTNTITGSSDYGVGSKGFSYQDINRWINNLKLLDNVDIESGTFWNTNKTEYIWNEEE